MKVNFMLVCEGKFDEEIVPHLGKLLRDCGATEATGFAYSTGGAVKGKFHAVVKAATVDMPDLDCLFVHRDADSQNYAHRYNEIRAVLNSAGYSGLWVGVVPVQEIEAWLLLNEAAIRRVAGKPRGSNNLELPSAGRVESLRNPKEALNRKILAASGKTGRRRERIKERLDSMCYQLLRDLPTGGPLEQVPAWARLKRDTKKCIAQLRNRNH